MARESDLLQGNAAHVEVVPQVPLDFPSKKPRGLIARVVRPVLVIIPAGPIFISFVDIADGDLDDSWGLNPIIEDVRLRRWGVGERGSAVLALVVGEGIYGAG